ncbi:alpha-amylase family glycosyl hydrolase [Puia dinghuensis]|uniref:Glycosyl hydrolase family 13 catalytic domain-containing protein n=1 Tax=Puia dinghuensis TaxID=1792502 RepID=A0A8J2XTU6_9BACT|nr:alpha-amylase family glycosyl hydrolase [Puia dinghuensis]GGB20448.1 hypothetical protein GCM10011511_50210 [Puia dinghuensis]
MRGFLLAVLSCFAGHVATAQLLTTQPLFPVDTSTVTITVDCSKGNQGLFGYSSTGDVYVHVGVITSQSTGPSNWRYVLFTWGTTNPAAHATYLGNNRYQYTISNIRSFFSVPAGEQILRIAILFRNGSGSLKQANSDGSDMFVPVYDGSLATRFLQPPFQPTYNPIPEPIHKTAGDSLPVIYAASKPANLSLYFNGTKIDSVTGQDSEVTTLHLTTAGAQQLIARASDGTTTRADTLSFYVSSATTIANPPSGTKDGINYLPGDTSVILLLYAPHKNKIVVVGDFNNWTQQTAYQMNETPDSNYFWLRIDHLQPATEYAYQYVIDDSITIADYNTEKVLDKAVDPGIPASTYPGLRAFPANAAGNLASVMRTAQPQYSWKVTSFQRPAPASLRIYELLVRDFTSAGTYQALIDTLAYLQRLGVNAIELMPVANFEGASSWGYNPNFYFAPDKVYGPANTLKALIDSCHGRGMAVIMDMVLNHSFGSSPMVQMYWDRINNIPAANSPWFSPYYTHDFDVGYQFNNVSPATAAFRERVIAYWLTNYHIDGYRFDLATGFTKINSCNATGGACNDALWNAYDTTRINIWNTLYAAQQAASPGSYCILEMFSANNERAVYGAGGMMVWNNMSYNYQQSTMGYNTGWDLSGATSAATGIAQAGMVNYQESHDEERLQYKNEQYGNSGASYNIKDTATGLHRDELAAAFWAMIPGPKMLWEFGELGYDYSINWCTSGNVDPSGGCRLSPKPARWDYLADARRKHLHDVYASLFRLNDSFPSLASSGQAQYSLSGVFRTLRVSGNGLSVVVVGNFDVGSQTGQVTFPLSGQWYNYLGTDSILATGSAQSISLNAGEYRVYTSKNLHDTASGAPVTPIPGGAGIRVDPNPATGSGSVIRYSLPVAADVAISVYSMMGNRLGAVDLGRMPAGSYTLTPAQLPVNFNTLAPGIYVLRLDYGQQHVHSSFLVVR